MYPSSAGSLLPVAELFLPCEAFVPKLTWLMIVTMFVMYNQLYRGDILMLSDNFTSVFAVFNLV